MAKELKLNKVLRLLKSLKLQRGVVKVPVCAVGQRLLASGLLGGKSSIPMMQVGASNEILIVSGQYTNNYN